MGGGEGASMSLPLTVVVPVRNEEVNLPACLASVAGWAERVVVVDSGSTDRTVAVAEGAGAEVVQFRWDGRFPKKRNWALRNAGLATPWVLFLDADEVPPREWWEEVAGELPRTGHAGYWVRHANEFLGRRLEHGDRIWKLCLFRVGAGEYERIEEDHWSHLDMEVHEHPVLAGTTGRLKTPVRHRDFKGLAAWKAKHAAYAEWEARRWARLQEAGPEAWEALTPRQRVKYRNLPRWWFAPAYLVAAVVVRGGFRDGRAGLVHAWLKAGYFADIRRRLRRARAGAGVSAGG